MKVQEMVGKTVERVNDRACNCLEIFFTDGTSILLEAENILPSLGLIGIVAQDQAA